MRPPSPVPCTCARLTLCSRAIRRTRGDDRTSFCDSALSAVSERGPSGAGRASAGDGGGSLAEAGPEVVGGGGDKGNGPGGGPAVAVADSAVAIGRASCRERV